MAGKERGRAWGRPGGGQRERGGAGGNRHPNRGNRTGGGAGGYHRFLGGRRSWAGGDGDSGEEAGRQGQRVCSASTVGGAFRRRPDVFRQRYTRRAAELQNYHG